MATALRHLVVVALAGPLAGCCYWSLSPVVAGRLSGDGGLGWGVRSAHVMQMSDSDRFAEGGVLFASGIELTGSDWGSRAASTFGASVSVPLGDGVVVFVRPLLAITAGAVEGSDEVMFYGVGGQLDSGLFVELVEGGLGFEVGAGCSADVTTVDAADGAQCTASVGFALAH